MWERIFDAMGDPVLVTDAAGRVTHANLACEHTLGTTRDQLVDRAFTDLVAETELTALVGLEQAFKGMTRNVNIAFRSGTSEQVSLSVTGTQMRDAAGVAQGYVLVCRDLTEVLQLLWESSRHAAAQADLAFSASAKREAAEQREQRQRDEGQQNKLQSIGQLAAGIAHEINTPNQFIGNNVQFIGRAFKMLMPALEQCKRMIETREHDDAALAEVLKKAKVEFLAREVPLAIEQTLDGVERVAKIVRAMKDFSHPSSGSKQLHDIHKAIETTATVAHNEWKYVADLVTDFDPSLPHVPCYVDELNQVFLNLFVNAAHAIEDMVRGTAERGVITVATRVIDDSVEVSIRDTGCGIAPEHRERIFEPFFTTKEVGRGTGQGLSLVYNVIVNRHGGSIDVDTAIGSGTALIVRLPLHSEGHTTTPEAP